MRHGFFIGDLSEQAGIPTQTIRYYEQLGLLEPPERTDSRYRVYTAEHLERLQFIRRAKTFGLSLEEIKQLIDMRSEGVAPCCHLKDLVGRHIEDLNLRIEGLTLFRDELLRRYEGMNGEAPEGKICGIVEGELPPNQHED